MRFTRRKLFSWVCVVSALLSETTAFATCPAQMTIYTDSSQCTNHHTTYYISWDAIPQVCLFYNSVSTYIVKALMAQTWGITPPTPGLWYAGPITPNTCIFIPHSYKYRAWAETTPDTVQPEYDHFWVSAEIRAPDSYCDDSQ